MKDEANHAPKVKPAGVGQATPADQAYAAALLERLSKSKFRSSFSLRPADRDYFVKKGRATICHHAHELLAARVGIADPPKDGKQTPSAAIRCLRRNTPRRLAAAAASPSGTASPKAAR